MAEVIPDLQILRALAAQPNRQMHRKQISEACSVENDEALAKQLARMRSAGILDRHDVSALGTTSFYYTIGRAGFQLFADAGLPVPPRRINGVRVPPPAPTQPTPEPAPVTPPAPASEEPSMPKTAENAKKIAAYLKGLADPVSVANVAQACQIPSEEKVRAALEELRAAGEAHTVGTGRGTKWAGGAKTHVAEIKKPPEEPRRKLPPLKATTSDTIASFSSRGEIVINRANQVKVLDADETREIVALVRRFDGAGLMPA